MIQFNPPYAKITRISKRRWHIRIVDGLMGYGDWWRRSEKRAIKKGQRELARYTTKKTWEQDPIRVTN